MTNPQIWIILTFGKLKFDMELILNSQNFEPEVVRSPLPVLVDFWAEWCGPCHMIAPSVAKIAQDYQGRLKVGKLNVDEHPGVAERYQIRSIPNLKLFKAGQVIDEIIGALPYGELVKVVDKHLT